jgi:signal transduction histidine kinase
LAPPRNLRPDRATAAARARHAPITVDQRRRLERDLHDGVQNELVALLVRLTVASEDPDTPPAVSVKLAALAGHVVAALDTVREVTHGITPRLLAKLGLREALGAQAVRAAIDVEVTGGAPRSSE